MGCSSCGKGLSKQRIRELYEKLKEKNEVSEFITKRNTIKKKRHDDA
jgi:hypothetical protein